MRGPRGHCSSPAPGGRARPGAPRSSCSHRRRNPVRPGLRAGGATPQGGPHTRHPPHATRGALALRARLQTPFEAAARGHTPGNTHARHAPSPATPSPCPTRPEGSDPQAVRPERAGSELCLRARPLGSVVRGGEVRPRAAGSVLLTTDHVGDPRALPTGPGNANQGWGGRAGGAWFEVGWRAESWGMV